LFERRVDPIMIAFAITVAAAFVAGIYLFSS
jgi:hypothetical protein